MLRSWGLVKRICCLNWKPNMIMEKKNIWRGISVSPFKQIAIFLCHVCFHDVHVPFRERFPKPDSSATLLTLIDVWNYEISQITISANVQRTSKHDHFKYWKHVDDSGTWDGIHIWKNLKKLKCKRYMRAHFAWGVVRHPFTTHPAICGPWSHHKIFGILKFMCCHKVGPL